MNSTNTSFIFWQKWLVTISCVGILVGFLFPFLSTVDFIAASYNQALAETFFGQKSFLEIYSFIINGYGLCSVQ